jgi:hypothetical protein
MARVDDDIPIIVIINVATRKHDGLSPSGGTTDDPCLQLPMNASVKQSTPTSKRSSNSYSGNLSDCHVSPSFSAGQGLHRSQRPLNDPLSLPCCFAHS